ncbi:lamin tail domain-containing protein [Crocinitomicaceae bacterium]|nr:lamin tail domain-containing protein [Crocinitomicaceae bacterium]
MKRTLLFLGTVFMGVSASAQDCSDLFISEYVEGVSNNKALEIYNPTDQPIDLSQYFVARYSNGSTSHTSAQTASIAVELVGTLAPYSTHVAVIDKRDSTGTGQEAPVWDELQAVADEFYSPVYDQSYAFYFNGNDALILYKGNISDIGNQQVIDVFGKVGENPGPDSGWSTGFPYNDGSGVIVSQDHSLIRKASIMTGQINPFPSFFDPLLEWDSIPALIEVQGNTTGNWASLGSHSCDCAQGSVNEIANVVNVTVAPNPSNGSFTVGNINSFTNVQVINSLGQEVYAVKNNGQTSLTIDLSERRGVYFVKLSGEGDAVTRRVIIK